MTNKLNQIEENGLDQDFMEQLKQGKHIDFIFNQDKDYKQVNITEKTAPDIIYLDVGFNMEEDDIAFSEIQHEVTWSNDNATMCGIKYIKASSFTK